MGNFHNLYINNTSIKNNKYFETSNDLLKYSNSKLNEIKAYKKRTGFLKNTNSKLGRKIYAFDLPAVVSCPDSEKCFQTCYANKGTFLFKSTKQSNTFNFAIALNDIKYLKKEIIKEIINKKIHCIRIHSSGDFFSKQYFLMWCKIAEKFPALKIFTYSKAPQIQGVKIPKNLNIISSFINIDNKNYLNYGSVESMRILRKKAKAFICPMTKGLEKYSPKNYNCSICKYCITKNKPVFIQH